MPPALRVERLFARGSRNLAELDLSPGPRFNVLWGDNGQGKSNLLELVYYLGALVSFRGAPRDELIAHGAERALWAARVSAEPHPVKAQVLLSRGKPRQLALAEKRPRSSAAWMAALPMVLFHPGDVALAHGAPEARRAFLDRILEQLDPIYARTLAEYGRALRSRNRLLKREPVEARAIAAFDPILAASGAVVSQSRAKVVEELAPCVETAFHDVAGTELPLRVVYRPRVAQATPEALAEALRDSLAKDIARGFTAEGPHADDLSLIVRERAARHGASQGQHRMMVLALKIAELELLSRRLGRIPILLLDDVSSELDRTKNERLFAALERSAGQVFVTTTDAALIRLRSERTDFHVQAGRVTPA